MAPDVEIVARPNEPVVEVRRRLEAPPAAVFALWTAPDHLCRWWGPQGADVSVVDCAVDLRVGGSYRYALRGPDGRVLSIDGRFVEIDVPSRLVTNWTVDSAPENRIVEVTTFDDSAEGTLVHIVTLHSSCAARDAQLATGAVSVMDAEFHRLDEVLAAG